MKLHIVSSTIYTYLTRRYLSSIASLPTFNVECGVVASCLGFREVLEVEINFCLIYRSVGYVKTYRGLRRELSADRNLELTVYLLNSQCFQSQGEGVRALFVACDDVAKDKPSKSSVE